MTDVRQVFASTKDPRAQAQAVAQHMRALLAVPGWLDEKLQSLPGGYGRADLHVDDAYGHPEPGFLAMCSAQRTGSGQLPTRSWGLLGGTGPIPDVISWQPLRSLLFHASEAVVPEGEISL